LPEIKHIFASLEGPASGNWPASYRSSTLTEMERVSLSAALQTRWRLHLEPFFATRRIAEVTSDLVAKYVDQRQLKKAQNATINLEMAALKRMFRIGRYSTPPKVLRLPKFPKVAEDNVRKGFLEDAQYEKLIGYCPDVWFRTLVEMGGVSSRSLIRHMSLIDDSWHSPFAGGTKAFRANLSGNLLSRCLESHRTRRRLSI
jgi:hypothetical protein